MPIPLRSLIRILTAAALLLVVLFSIHLPPISPAQVTARSLNLNKASDFTCMDEVIPGDQDVLFAADPGTPNLLAQYYRSQFFLSPRLVIMPESDGLVSAMADYNWIIETSLDTEPFPELNQRYRLALVKDCDDFYVLNKTSQP